MATIAIGDIHGNAAALDDLLGQLRGEATRRDTVVFVGDYIDRGPDSKACVDRILGFRRDAAAAVVCLRGNHEDWMLRTLDDYTRHSWLLAMEGLDTIRSYSPEAADLLQRSISLAGLSLFVDRRSLPYDVFFACLPPAHLSFFRDLALLYRGPDGLCTHGGLDPRVPRLEDQTADALIWGGDGFPDTYRGEETIAYGHRNDAVLDAQGWPHPRIAGATIGLDTISHGVLTAVRLEDRRVFQSRRYQVS
jgi:serine/threonine protein phosphatase 1